MIVSVTRAPAPLGAVCRPQILDHVCVSCCGEQPSQLPLQQKIQIPYSVPPAPIATQTAPAPDPNACARLYDYWVTQNPEQATCMRSSDRQAALDLCEAVWVRKDMTVAAGTQATERLIGEACERQRRNREAEEKRKREEELERQLKPPPSGPPIVEPDQGGGPDDIVQVVPGDGSETPPTPVAQPKLTPFQTWGPIVGIGLLVAGALYAARQRSYTDRRSAKKRKKRK